jgi:hypothetical protein
MPITLPWTLIRTDRLELLEAIAGMALRVSYHLADTDGDLGHEHAQLWDLHDIASQYECYEHQRSLGFPKRPGGLPRVPNLIALHEEWRTTRARDDV